MQTAFLVLPEPAEANSWPTLIEKLPVDQSGSSCKGWAALTTACLEFTFLCSSFSVLGIASLMTKDKNFDGTCFKAVDDGVREIDQGKHLPSVFGRSANARKLFKKPGSSIKFVHETTGYPYSSF